LSGPSNSQVGGLQNWVLAGALKLRRSFDRMSEIHFAYLMLTPTIIVMIVLGIFPIAYSIGLSFFRYRLNVAASPSFVGLANYIRMFTDAEFWASLVRTVYFSAASVGMTVLLGLITALLLNQDIKGKTLYIALLLIPWAMPKVVSGLIWRWIFDGNYGIMNAIAVKLGLVSEYQWWFIKSPLLALTLVAVVEVWKRMPFAAVLLLAALGTIPEPLHRAAQVDGATPWQRFRFVTLPGIKHVLMVVLILETTWSIKVFDTIYVLTNGGPANATMVSYFYVYKHAFDYLDIGYGAAMGYFVTLVILGLAIVYNKLLGKAY
jgi:multiple sugar transport system permease protein